jgi:hypothetical protein
MVLFTCQEAAELADIKPALVKLWLQTGKFKTSQSSTMPAMMGSETKYYFTEADVSALVAFAKTKQNNRKHQKVIFVDDGQENFTVAEIASLWNLSRDTIQRLFQDEPDVVVLGNKNPRGKRRRVTLRIPRDVMERVKKRRSNP